MTLPGWSVMVICVLLKVEAMWTMPVAMFFLTRFFPFFGVTGDATMGSMPPRLGAAGAAASSFLGCSAAAGGALVCFSSATLISGSLEAVH